MRLYMDNAAQYIQALAYCISKDPASLEHWHCLHIPCAPTAPIGWAEVQLKKIADRHPDYDCDAVYCPDGDILLMSKKLSPGELCTLSPELLFHAPGESPPQAAVYDLFQDWRKIRFILFQKCPHLAGITAQPFQLEQHNFGEVGSLQEAFHENIVTRTARLPLYILVVEDDPITRKVVTDSLKNDYAVITAKDAQEAVTNYLLYAPDIVFLDINLPDANGMQALKQIMDCDPQAFVVMFSGNGYLDNILTAINNGASGFITKPFRKERIRQYIAGSAHHHHKIA